MKSLKYNLFPTINDFFTRSYVGHRKRVLESISGKILEIGFGTGLSIDCFPSSASEIIGLEPNPGMRSRANKLIGEIGRNNIKVIDGRVENLPFMTDEFDAVVSFFTLCSVNDLRKAIIELRRVLRRGGKLYLIEHTVQPKGVTRSLQLVIQPVWKKLSCGCNINRDTLNILIEHGFKLDERKCIGYSCFPNFLSPVQRGILTKI